METIIGRLAEIKRTTVAVNSPRAEFIALYGRRRVGKTFLVNQVFKNQFAFKMTGVIEGTSYAMAHNDYYRRCSPRKRLRNDTEPSQVGSSI